MLQQVLQEIKASPGAINLDDLARKLGIERGALEGMVQFWVRKGRLRDSDLDPTGPDCSSASCSTCGHEQGCPFVMTMPRTYSLKSRDAE